MKGRRGGTWFALSITVCSTVTGLGCRQANEQCIDVLGKVAVMEKPWPDWVDVIGVPNSVIDSIGPGRYQFTERYEDETFIAYRVTTKTNVSGYVVQDTLVRQCGIRKRTHVASLGKRPGPVIPVSAQSAPVPPR
jgi:hypothetical protein